MPKKKTTNKKIQMINELISSREIDKALELANFEEIKHLFVIGTLFLQKGNSQVAEKVFNRIIKLEPNNVEAWSNKGAAMVSLGKPNEAIKCFDKALKINPDHAGAWYNKGVALIKLGKPNEAVKCYNEALRINPNFAEAWYNKGTALGSLGRYDEAVKCFNRTLKINPDHAGAWYNKGVTMNKLGKPNEEIKCYNKALRINHDYTRAWYNKGVALIKFGKPNEAVKCFEKTLRINPNDAEAWLNKGVTLIELGRYDEAVKCYNEALRINPSRAEAWYNKGVTFGKLGRYDEAAECFDKALRINPRHAEAWGAKGTALDSLGKLNEAIKCFTKALNINPKLAEAWSAKGTALVSLGKPNEAIKCYNEALRINPRHADAWFNKGVTMSRLGKPNEAVECFEKALEINPKFTEAWSNKGVALNKLGKPNEAVECFEKALEINPKLAEAWSAKGAAMISLGRYDEAVECFNKALRIKPDFAEAWSNKGAAMSRLGKHNRAVKCFEKALEINPNFVEVWSNKGATLDSLGRYDEAVECFNKVLKIKPNSAEAWSNKGITMISLRKYGKAVKCFEEVLRIKPNSAEAWSNKGAAMISLGKPEEAVECFEKALEINPNFAEAWLNKGTAMISLGKPEEAVECFEKALRINPNLVEAHANLGNICLDLHEYAKAKTWFGTAKRLFSERELKKDGDKAYGYELWAEGMENWSGGNYAKAVPYFNKAVSIMKKLDLGELANSLELISKIIPLDQQFMDALHSENLFELMERSSKVSRGIAELEREFQEKPASDDVIEMLIAKHICFTALHDALEFKEPKLELAKLNIVRKLLKKRKFEDFILAVNSIEDFINLLLQRKLRYNTLEEIPEEDKARLLQILRPSSKLDGKLTEKIPVGEYITSKTKVELEEPEIVFIPSEDTKKEWVRVCLVQLNFSLVLIPSNKEFGYILKENERGSIKKKIFEALEIARENNVDIICFPELSTVKEWVNEVKNQFPNMIVVFGSYYENSFNNCPIIVNGRDYYIQKINPSPVSEKGVWEGQSMKGGKRILVFQTGFGSFAVLICWDYGNGKEVSRILFNKDEKIKDVDFIIVPEYNKDIQDFHKQADLDCKRSNCPYILQVNAWKVSEKEVGGTCVFGMENKSILETYKMAHLKPDDNFEYKLCEISEESFIILDLDIKRKGVVAPTSGPKMKSIGYYVFRGDKWEKCQ